MFLCFSTNELFFSCGFLISLYKSTMKMLLKQTKCLMYIRDFKAKEVELMLSFSLSGSSVSPASLNYEVAAIYIWRFLGKKGHIIGKI